MLVMEVLISELLTVDGLAASAVVVREVTTLQHEVRDDAVEGRVLIAKALFVRRQSSEVFASLRALLPEQFEFNPLRRLIVN